MFRTLAFTFALVTSVGLVRSGNAAKIVTECPQFNDFGSHLVIRKLLPDTLIMKRVGQESQELAPPLFGTELKMLFWHKGMAPITNAGFSCIYEDKSELYIPIVGMLLSCRVLIPSRPTPPDEWPILCTSETDPGLLLNK